MHAFFSKIGHTKRQLTWIPTLIVRLCIGILMILSGFFNLFDPEKHSKILQSFIDCHLFYPELNAYVIPALQILSGLLILIGLLTTPASCLLLIIMVISILSYRLPLIATYHNLQALEHLLHSSECLCALIFLWLCFSGPGRCSIDAIYSKK